MRKHYYDNYYEWADQHPASGRLWELSMGFGDPSRTDRVFLRLASYVGLCVGLFLPRCFKLSDFLRTDH
jgi:hypothetical protein